MMQIMFLSFLTLNIGTYSFSFKIDENLFNFNIFVFGGGGNPWNHKYNFSASLSFFFTRRLEGKLERKKLKSSMLLSFWSVLNRIVSWFYDFLLVVFHIITSRCALGIKELMLQFCGLPIFPGTWFSEEQRNYKSPKTSLFCFYFLFRRKDKLLGSHEIVPSFTFHACSVCSWAVSHSALV